MDKGEKMKDYYADVRVNWGRLVFKTKTRVYAIIETDDVHEISNEDFMDKAEELGYVWSRLGFQNFLNREGNGKVENIYNLVDLHYRFIDVEVSK